MSKKLSGSSSQHEDLELEELFKNDPDAWYTYEVLSAIEDQDGIPNGFRHEIRSLLQHAPGDMPSATTPVTLPETVTPTRPLRAPWLRTWWIAASFVVLACAAYVLYSGVLSHPATELNEVVALPGTNTDITLADGSKIRLNAGSKLSYPKNFSSASTREVTLSGEAYFTVVHDARHPFIIHTQHIDIRDIGTVFNVKAYPEDEVTEASLIEGAIEVSVPNTPGAGKVLLKPSEKLTFYNEKAGGTDANGANASRLFQVSRITPTAVKGEFAETAWVKNGLVFKDQTFGEIARVLERRYDIEIVIKDESIKNGRITCSFNEDESLDKAVRELQLLLPFRYTIDQNRVTITP